MARATPRIDPAIANAVIAMRIANPTWGKLRIARWLYGETWRIGDTPAGSPWVSLRHDEIWTDRRWFTRISYHSDPI